MTRLRLSVAMLALGLCGSVINGQESEVKTEKDAKFGYSFTHKTLQNSAVQMDTTVLGAYVVTEPGSYLEVEWLKPRDNADYLKSLQIGMTMLDLEPAETKEVDWGGRKATRVLYKSEEVGDGTQALHIVEKAEKDQWFWGVTCIATGDTADADMKTLAKAADTFSLDMAKAAKPATAQYVDKVFGFHITLEGFKPAAKPWKESLLRMWGLYDGKTHLGTFMVKLVRREKDLEQQLKDLRALYAKAGRKITSESAIEVAGLKGLNMSVEFDQAGQKNVHDQYILYADEVLWHVVAAYRPAISKGKESELKDALASFKPPAPAKKPG